LDKRIDAAKETFAGVCCACEMAPAGAPWPLRQRTNSVRRIRAAGLRDEEIFLDQKDLDKFEKPQTRKSAGRCLSQWSRSIAARSATSCIAAFWAASNRSGMVADLNLFFL